MARSSRKNTDASAMAAPIQKSYQVGGYVRLSAEDKKQKGDSIETQQAIIAAYVNERPDLELAEIYIDNGLSGQTFERPAFSRMISDMESGKINCCVSKDLSRLGRNAIDTGYYVEKFFPTKGIRYIAITDDYDSADANSGGIMLSLKNMVNEAYALEIGRKIRQTKQMNIRKGLFVGRFAPYGFLKSKEDSHKLVPDPYAAPIVRRMYEMAAEGNPVSEIAGWLNTNGILPPKRYLHSIGLASEKEASGHIHWNKGVVYSILKNRVYCGDMVQGKYSTKSYVQTSKPKSEWIIVEDTHDGIVSRGLFDEVQKLWGNIEYAKRGASSDNIFLRKLFCGHCGYTMRRAKSGKTSHQFKCETRVYYSKDDCVLVSINENALKEMLLDTLNKQAEAFVCENIVTSQTIKSKNDDKAELQGLQVEISKNSNFLKSLYESLTQGDITHDEYREMKAGYESKIALLTDKEKELRKAMLNQAAKEAAKSKAAAKLQTVRHISDLTAETIDMLIDKILIYEGQQIEVHFKFADETAVAGKGEAV